MLFWTYFRRILVESHLSSIASADYCSDYEEHLTALRVFLNSADAGVLKGWHPREVLELTRWQPTATAPVPVAFSATALLVGCLDPDVREYSLSINENLIISIDGIEFLGAEYAEVVHELTQRLYDCGDTAFDEEAPFIPLAKCLVESYLEKSVDASMGQFKERLERQIHNGWLKSKPPSLFDLSTYNLMNSLWAKHLNATGLCFHDDSLSGLS